MLSRLVSGPSDHDFEQDLARLKTIEQQVAYVDVPLSYMNEFYHLRLHLTMLQNLIALRAHTEPAPVDAERQLVVTLADARRVSAPLEWFPRLLQATPVQRANWRLIGHGIGIHWDDVDEDISVRSLLAI